MKHIKLLQADLVHRTISFDATMGNNALIFFLKEHEMKLKADEMKQSTNVPAQKEDIDIKICKPQHRPGTKWRDNFYLGWEPQE